MSQYANQLVVGPGSFSHLGDLKTVLKTCRLNLGVMAFGGGYGVA